MSIAGIGSTGPGNLSQVLASMLSKLDAKSSTPDDDSTSTQSTTTDTTTAASDGSLTGSTKPDLSSMILGVLMGMQNQSTTTDTTGDTSSSSSAATASSSTGSDAASKLFSAMDTDSDGTVSQTEMESYIEGVGGTASQADSLYSSLNTSGSSNGLTEADLASQAPQSGGPDEASHAHHHHHGAGAASNVGNDLVSALDGDDDGSISQTELTSFLTANGGTTSEADSLFSSLSSDGTSGITASDINTAVGNMTANFAANPYTSILDATTTPASGNSVSLSA